MSETQDNKERQESVRLDEIMRLLFDMSKETLVNMLNGLFGEAFEPEFVEITKDNAKFVNEQLEIIEGDLFLRIFDQNEPSKPNLFHIEFQTSEDGTMAIRVLRYDLNKAVENQRLGGDNDEIILCMPQSLVIHIEEHESIPDEYKALIIFADGDTKKFTVPVLKYWKLTDKDLIDRNLFPLLPLQIFLLRAELDKLTKSNDSQAKNEAILKARDITERIAKEAVNLNKAGRLIGADYRKVLTAMENLFVHLNSRYEGDKNLNEGVQSMLVELNVRCVQEVSKEAEQRGEYKKALRMAAEMLLDGEPIKKIIKYTKLTEQEIKDIEKTAKANA